MNFLPIIQLDLRPGVIELGWGHPDPALLPVANMRAAAVQALDTWGADMLAYGADAGAGPLREWLCEHITRTEGRAVTPDEMVITGGNSYAIDQVCTLLTASGDTVLVEAPTYHLAVSILRDHPIDLVPVPVDEHGLQVDALTATLDELRRAGRRARLLYTIPTFHNPTGVSLSAERRVALVTLAAERELLIVEDDVYRELTYDGAAPPSLWSIAPSGTVVRLGSFAKSLAPGVRLGWLTTDAATAQRFIAGGVLDSGGAVNHFAALVVAQFCRSGAFEPQVARLRAAYRARRDALLAGLAEHLPPGCAWVAPGGGFFVWVRLPDGVDATALLPHAVAHGVGYVPGARFHINGSGTNALRLAWSLYPPDELTEAARRLGVALRSKISLKSELTQLSQ